jgi:hypothetical protein
MEGLPGVTAIEVRTKEFTFNVSEALMAPRTAEILVDPPPKPLATPAAVIPATDGWEEFHVTEVVRSCVLPSEYCPVATNCWFWPIATEGFAGVTEIDSSVGGDTVTVKVVEPVTEPKVALIVTVPAVKPEASPAETLATLVLDEFQAAVPVRSCVLPSL